MASSRLYKDARTEFIRQCESRYHESKDVEMLRDFLSMRGSPEEAQEAALNLKTDAGRKWGTKKVGDTEIPGEWIDSLMGNIGNFVAVGNYAMTGAPESVGLAWFAVKLTLSAIQSNYALYTLFGAGLTDISEIMIIIPHYDRLYDERSKAKVDWKQSPVVDKLFKDIVSAYVAVLNFSFSIRRHLSAGTMARVRHGFKDFFGASEAKFRAKLDNIAVLKKKIVDDSQAIFQDKSLQQLESVKGIVSNIEGAVNQVRDFQATLTRMHEEQTEQWQLVLKKMEEIKATTKPITAWDQALLVFEKNKEALSPQKDTSDALSDAIDKRHPATSQWIFDQQLYNDWKDPTSNKLLCLSGEQGSGKSVVLATVIEQLGSGDVENSTLLYFSCGSTKRGAPSKGVLSVDDVCHTILYQLYSLAREDDNNVKLLEDCNKVFANPKAKKIGKVISQSNNDEKLPDFVDAFLAIAKYLKLCVIVALDEVDCLTSPDQEELAARLRSIVDPSETVDMKESPIKVLVGCRSGTEFTARLPSAEVDVGYFNKDDMMKKLSSDLQTISGLTEAEQEEAAKAIVDKAGPRFTYVHDIALPFMREPFQRPLSRRLQFLPEGMNNIYHEALRKMGSNYVDLLRTALTWTLLAPVPLKVEEIMDAYHGTYVGRGSQVEEEARSLTDTAFGKPQALEIEQLRNASGPFLRIEQTTPDPDQPVPDTDHFVSLRDAPLVREFCMHASKADPSSNHAQNGEICARCKSALNESKTLEVSPKEGHLQIALKCLRNLNNPVFQRRATSKETVPQWSAADASSESHAQAPSPTEESTVDDKATTSSDDTPKPDTVDEKDGAKSDPVGEETETPKPEDEDETPPADSVSKEENEDASHEKDDGNDSDDSQDDEDRGEIDLLKAQEYQLKAQDSGNDDVVLDNIDRRTTRYELIHWTYHVEEAEKLWTAEERASDERWSDLMKELDHFVSSKPTFFTWWQTLDGVTLPFLNMNALSVSAYFGLTCWAEHLIKKGAHPNELSGQPISHNALQAAGTSAKSHSMLKLLLNNGADPNAEPGGTLPAFHYWLLNENTDSYLETVKIMLEHGANPTVSDQWNSWTALHYFAWHGTDVDVFEMLMDHSVDGTKPNINALTKEDTSPLHVLLWRREVPKPLLKAFLARGADINQDDHESTRPLQMASVWGELETLKILCSQSISKIDDDDKEGHTAIFQAVLGNHPKCLRYLAELGADTNWQQNRGAAAIHYAAKLGEKDCVDILLANGARPNITDKHNRTPLFSACRGESQETALFLFDLLLEKKVPFAEINMLTKRRRSPLREAANRGFDELVDKMIKVAQAQDDMASLAINQADERKGMTALHRAAWFGHANCVKLLLTAGADVSCRDLKKKTALILAYEQWTLASHQSSFEEIISLLIAGAPEDAIADAELVAICAINGSTRLLQQMCTLGADLNRQDRYGWTPLDLARKFQQESAGRFLKQQAAWAGMLPSRWAPAEGTNIAEDGTSVSHSSGERICVSTDKPLPAGLDTFYFEVTSKPIEGVPVDTAAEWAIGFCTIGGQSIAFPGWPRRSYAPSARSWGYHGDNGGLYQSGNDQGTAVGFAQPYKAGDTVGAGVDLTTGKIYFKRNGERIESGFDGVQGRLFPLLGLVDRVELETNFRGPWKEANEKE